MHSLTSLQIWRRDPKSANGTGQSALLTVSCEYMTSALDGQGATGFQEYVLADLFVVILKISFNLLVVSSVRYPLAPMLKYVTFVMF